jgi:hypothetical protein
MRAADGLLTIQGAVAGDDLPARRRTKPRRTTSARRKRGKGGQLLVTHYILTLTTLKHIDMTSTLPVVTPSPFEDDTSAKRRKVAYDSENDSGEAFFFNLLSN